MTNITILVMKTDRELKDIFGQNIKKRREYRGLSQERLAEQANVSKNTISDIESGQKFARAKTLVLLAAALETDVYELLKPDSILPDKVSDIFVRYNEDLKESMEKLGKKYMERMRNPGEIH